jgi:hypothetical protein
MFSLLHGDIFPQALHLKLFPVSVDVSNVPVSPIWIGDGNHVLQDVHCSSIRFISVILCTPVEARKRRVRVM